MDLAQKFAAEAAGGTTTLAFDPIARDEFSFVKIAIADIERDPNQPRKDVGDLKDLKKSIESNGLIQPVVVSALATGKFLLLAGERRFRAAVELKHKTIDALVRSVDESKRLELQIMENLHRKNLTAWEESAAYNKMYAELGLSHEQIAKRINKSRSYVTQLMSLAKVPGDIKEECVAAKLSKEPLILIAKARTAEEMRATLEVCKSTRSKDLQRGAAKLHPSAQTTRTARITTNGGVIVTITAPTKLTAQQLQDSWTEASSSFEVAELLVAEENKSAGERAQGDYELRLRPVRAFDSKVPAVQRLRIALKELLRTHGFRCVSQRHTSAKNLTGWRI